MHAILIVALFTFTQAQGQDRGQQPERAREGASATATANSIDGTWTVLALEKNGQSVADARNMTVTVRNNIVTFSGGDKNHTMKAMRLEFGPQGTIRVSEADAASGGTGGASGTGGTSGTGNDRRPEGGSGKAATDQKQTKQGVYICSQNYCCLCLHDDSGTTGDRTGGTTGGTTGDRTGGTTGDRTGGNTGDRTGGTGTSGGSPNLKSGMVIILQRSGTGTGNGTNRERP